MPKLKFCLKKAHSHGFSVVIDKTVIPNRSVTSENLCKIYFLLEDPAALCKRRIG